MHSNRIIVCEKVLVVTRQVSAGRYSIIVKDGDICQSLHGIRRKFYFTGYRGGNLNGFLTYMTRPADVQVNVLSFPDRPIRRVSQASICKMQCVCVTHHLFLVVLCFQPKLTKIPAPKWMRTSGALKQYSHSSISRMCRDLFNKNLFGFLITSHRGRISWVWSVKFKRNIYSTD